MNTPNRQEKEAEVLQLSNKLTDAISKASSHERGLEGLLMAYITVATVHTCCTQEAANAAMRVSMFLAREAASKPKHPIH